jgi:molybdopterin-containing oxidoreductase family membrane subunit
MVVTLAVPLRHFFHMEAYITQRHLDNCAKLMLVTGLIVGYGYASEAFMSWYSYDTYEHYMQVNRAFGFYGWAYWALIVCNATVPQFFWFRRVRNNALALFFLSLLIQFGMWTERFVIIIQSLSRDFMPSAWHLYFPTRWDYFTLFGSVGLFACAFYLFVRFLPALSMTELRELVRRRAEPEKQEAAAEGGGV